MVRLTRDEFVILYVTLSWLLGFVPLFAWVVLDAVGRTPKWRAPRWFECFGLALVLVPFVRMGIGFVLSFERLFVFTVLQPASRESIWRAVWNDAFYDFLIPIAGLALLANALPWFRSDRAPRQGPHDIIRANGLKPRNSWGRDLAHGVTLFAFIALAYAGAFLLSKTLLSGLGVNGDESQYWINITVVLIVLRSGMAGLTEEFLFRGVLMSRLSKVMPFAAAAVIQALFFALVHSGYGTWTHVIGPFVFGLGMAWVARQLSVTVAAVLHAQVNIVFFAFDVAGYVPGAWWLLAVLAVLNIAAAIFTRAEAVRVLWASLMRGLRRASPR